MDENQVESMMESEIHAALRDAVLTEIKAAPEVWQRMSQEQQDGVIGRVDRQMHNLIAKCIKLLIGHEFPVVSGTLDQVVVKDQLKAVVIIPKASPDRFDLIDSVGREIRITVADSQAFSATAGEVKSEPDQPDLPGAIGIEHHPDSGDAGRGSVIDLRPKEPEE